MRASPENQIQGSSRLFQPKNSQQLYAIEEDSGLKANFYKESSNSSKFNGLESKKKITKKSRKIKKKIHFKGNWTQEEDELLLKLIGEKGARNWSVIAKKF